MTDQRSLNFHKRPNRRYILATIFLGIISGLFMAWLTSCCYDIRSDEDDTWQRISEHYKDCPPEKPLIVYCDNFDYMGAPGMYWPKGKGNLIITRPYANIREHEMLHACGLTLGE